MSWWDTSSISNLASQALKNAQKKIDKVLDIEADEKTTKPKRKKASSPLGEDAVSTGKTGGKEEEGAGHDFWSGWMGKSEEDSAASTTPGSSWHLPWASPSQENLSPTSGQSSKTSGRLSRLSSAKKESARETLSSPSRNQEKIKVQEKSESDTEQKISGTVLDSSQTDSSQPVSHSNKEVISHPETENSCAPEAEKVGSGDKGEETTLNVEGIAPVADSVQEGCDGDSANVGGRKSESEECKIVVSASSAVGAETELPTSLPGSVPMYTATPDKELILKSCPTDQNLEWADSGWQDVSGDVIIEEGVDDKPYNNCDISCDPESQVKNFQSKSNADNENVVDVTESKPFVLEIPLINNPEPHKNFEQDSLQQSFGGTEEDMSSDNFSYAEDMTCDKDCGGGISTSGSFLEEKEIHEDTSDSARVADIVVSENLGTAVSYEEETMSGSKDESLLNLPEHQTSGDNLESVSHSNGENSLSQEYVDVSMGHSTSQLLSLDSSALSSEDCLQSSYEMDIEGLSKSNLNDPDPLQDLAGSAESSDTGRLDSSADTIVGRMHQDSESGYSLFGKGVEVSSQGQGEAVHKLEEVNLDLCQDSSSTHSTDMKSLIQEAMDDLSNKAEDSGSDNHSNGEAKSESSKVDSEMEKSVYSGHESSDDIETTTSSDIEILSAPHFNEEGSGGSKFHTSFPLAPLHVVAQQGGQHRFAPGSHSSSSSNSKAGEGEGLSPERGEGGTWRDDDISAHELEAVKEEGPDSPYHPERLLKKLAEMAEVLQAREAKLISLSKENHSLAEDVSILRCQLKKAEEARDAEAADLDALTQEFTVRIGEAEKKMQTVLKEKERLKQQLNAAEKELARRSADADVEAMLEEKRQQVEELLLEGEKLSKQQLQSSTIIKKLRAKEKESDSTITSQKKKLEDQASELEHLKVVLNSKEEMEKKQNDAISQFNTAVQKQEKEIAKLRSELEDANEKSRGLQVALDNSYKEIAELHKSNATQDSKAQEAALSAETHVREELKAAMEREQMRFKQEREAFIMQADDLRLDMTRLEKEHSRREDVLRQEIAYLQTRLQEDEARSQELTQSVSSATRPLLRQIENLQATYGAQANAWERVEKNLTDRLAEAQTSLAVAQEKERTANQQYMELSAKVAALEASNSSLRQEKATLIAKVESNKNQLEELQDTRNSFVAQLESSKKVLLEELGQLKLDKMHLESQLNVERSRVETEKKKTQALEEQLRLAERPRSRGTPSPSPSMSVSRQESVVGSVHEGYPGSMMNWSFHDESDSGSTVGVSRASVYESLRQSGAAIAVENMSSQLKLREGEITQLQSEISRLERTRESMAKELVNLSNQNEELQEVKLQHEQLQVQFKELNQRYSAILQMYGEKEEQVQELRLDLQDVKEMYKTQIDALMAK